MLPKTFLLRLKTAGLTVMTTAAVTFYLKLSFFRPRMNKLIEFSPDNRYITVEPGMTNQQVQDIVKEKGFFWPPDPTSAAFCSIGGNLACNSAGPRAVKYGTPRENTLGLRAVTGAGKEIRVGVHTSKIKELDRLSKKYDLPIINFSHAGNGNIHVKLLLDPDEPEQGKKAHQCLDEIFSLVKTSCPSAFVVVY